MNHKERKTAASVLLCMATTDMNMKRLSCLIKLPVPEDLYVLDWDIKMFRI